MAHPSPRVGSGWYPGKKLKDIIQKDKKKDDNKEKKKEKKEKDKKKEELRPTKRFGGLPGEEKESDSDDSTSGEPVALKEREKDAEAENQNANANTNLRGWLQSIAQTMGEGEGTFQLSGGIAGSLLSDTLDAMDAEEKELKSSKSRKLTTSPSQQERQQFSNSSDSPVLSRSAPVSPRGVSNFDSFRTHLILCCFISLSFFPSFILLIFLFPFLFSLQFLFLSCPFSPFPNFLFQTFLFDQFFYCN